MNRTRERLLVALVIVAWLLVRSIAFGEAHTDKYELSAICQTWATTINAEPDSYVMHVRGCDSDPSGQTETWYRNTTRCDTLAYSLALSVWAEGRIASDDEIYEFIGSYQFGCVVAEDGTWYEESL